MNRRQFATATAVAFAPSALLGPNEVRPHWEADGVGSLARIGILTPDDDPVPESEIRTMAPADVSIHASRVLLNSDPLSFAEGADSAARLLTRLKPRLILYAVYLQQLRSRRAGRRSSPDQNRATRRRRQSPVYVPGRGGRPAAYGYPQGGAHSPAMVCRSPECKGKGILPRARLWSGLLNESRAGANVPRSTARRGV
jgi:hypothetical protein